MKFHPFKDISDIDKVIGQSKVWYNEFSKINDVVLRESMSNDYDELCFGLIKESFIHHYKNNKSYKNYCVNLGVDSSFLTNIKDIEKIPLITSSQFKISQVITGDRTNIVKVCHSSGTMGSISNIFRDDITLSRFLSGLHYVLDQFTDVKDAFCFHLGPSKIESGNLWFSYVMSATDILFPTINYVTNNEFHLAKLILDLKEFKGKYRRRLLIGPPIMFVRLFDYLKENKIEMGDCEDLFIVTAGGWKKFDGQSIKRDVFEKKLQDNFPNLKVKNIRDYFNMVELNTIFAESSSKIKYLPPWVRVIVVNPITFKPVPQGEFGVLCYYDASANSYPGFIYSEDFGRQPYPDHRNPDNIIGQSIEIRRRIKSTESRGCALKVSRDRLKKQ
jgi:long-chain-fatty-acid---luciferin-component ligase